MDPEALVKEGKLVEAREAITTRIKNDPSKAENHVFMFQLLSVLGEWDRALTRLNVAAGLNVDADLLKHMCTPALQAEALRERIFRGERSPLIFGEPDEWLGWLVQSLGLLAQGKAEAAADLRDKAFEQAPAAPGRITIGDGEPETFEWLADADGRLGPVLEAVIDHKYYWLPLHRVRSISMGAPTALRELIWIPATIVLTTGVEQNAMLFARYPGSHASDDSSIRLARKTDLTEAAEGLAIGLGQRMLATDGGEHALLDVRRIEIDWPEGADGRADAE